MINLFQTIILREVLTMQGHYIETRVIHVSIPEPAYQQLKKLAEEADRTVPGYVRYLITREFQRLGLPLYF